VALPGELLPVDRQPKDPFRIVIQLEPKPLEAAASRLSRVRPADRTGPPGSSSATFQLARLAFPAELEKRPRVCRLFS